MPRWIRALPALALLLALPAMAPTAAAKDVSITLHVGTYPNGTMYIQPPRPTIQAGDRVTMTFVNDDASNGQVTTPHDNVIIGLTGGVDAGDCAAVNDTTRGEAGETKIEFEMCDKVQATQTFTPASAGTFYMKCEVQGHEQLGQHGNLVVQGASSGTTKSPGFGPEALAAAALAGAVLLARRRRAFP